MLLSIFYYAIIDGMGYILQVFHLTIPSNLSITVIDEL